MACSFIALQKPLKFLSASSQKMYASKLMLVSLLLSITVFNRTVAHPPPPCSRLECPTYNLIDSGKDDSYEIRNYTDIVLITTSPIQGVDVVKATETGFQPLFSYILGKNDKQEMIAMTAPVVTQVSSSRSGSGSQYAVSLYIPKKNQAEPPTAEGLTIQRIRNTYAAVKQFSGFISETSVANATNALIKSISGTKYMDAIKKTHGGDPAKNYLVGQYNAPFELMARTNEILLTFQM